MKHVFALTLSVFIVSSLYSQKRSLKFDLITGIHKSTGYLNFENNFGWRIGGAIRYSFKDKSYVNILQVNYDKFIKPERSRFADYPDPKENSEQSNTLSFLTGYSYPLFQKVYIGGNVGVGFVGHDREDRVAKLGLNPFISITPFQNVFVDLGYLNFRGGSKNTNYVNFSLRYSL
jgi:hypothetical protein